ncbi:MAG TPA: hypothetical protein PLE40_02070 [Candidatus Pacearchaeota archaeon]|nr:hypothetical protein [Candidatus Pacearchaeota archaeon]HOL90314.1 hypothetical protein [Candidatus Pacearchaeota archaeon]HPO68512.1 hypothetical protein [Candidatus Pacearchaeota archaeon]
MVKFFTAINGNDLEGQINKFLYQEKIGWGDFKIIILPPYKAEINIGGQIAVLLIYNKK